MSRYSELFQPGIVDYILNHSVREPEILARLREETASHPRAIMQIPAEQGALLRLLVKMTNAVKTIEVGVFTGYSSLATAMALPENGRIVACDVSEEFTSVARRYWKDAGVEQKIDLRIGPASETLERLIAEGGEGEYDFAFIDADKPGYATYYEQCLRLLRKNGLIALDNMLQRGRVLDEDSTEENVVVLRKLNDFIHCDERVDQLLTPFGDGLTLALKR